MQVEYVPTQVLLRLCCPILTTALNMVTCHSNNQKGGSCMLNAEWRKGVQGQQSHRQDSQPCISRVLSQREEVVTSLGHTYYLVLVHTFTGGEVTQSVYHIHHKEPLFLPAGWIHHIFGAGEQVCRVHMQVGTWMRTYPAGSESQVMLKLLHHTGYFQQKPPYRSCHFIGLPLSCKSQRSLLLGGDKNHARR